MSEPLWGAILMGLFLFGVLVGVLVGAYLAWTEYHRSRDE